MWLFHRCPLIVLISTVGFLIAFILFKLIRKKWIQKQQFKQLANKVVVITGGSQGIGRSLAIACFSHGANVIVIARNENNLVKIREELESKRINNTHQIVTKQADVTNESQVNQVFDEIINEFNQIDYLITCAGKSISNAFDDAPIEEFHQMMNLNYFGTVYPIKYVVKQMKKQRSGHISIVSSIAGLVGLYGFSGYSSSKFALVGLAQCLHMELKSFNVNVTCCFPPDTDTPGFEEEEKTKPEITKLICESGGLVSPDEVANSLLIDCFNKKFISTIGFTNKLVTIAASGMMPVTSFMQIFCEIISIGICRLFSAIFLFQCHRIIRSTKQTCYRKQST